MDDLKFFGKIDQLPQGLITTVKIFGDDIRMDSGLDSCVKVILVKRKRMETSNISLNQQNAMKESNPAENSKYL